ncbi:MAG: glycosyl hydrolase [Dermatophilaceae bacterium]
MHYKKGDMDFYFIRNTSDKWSTVKYGFRQNSKIPELWNPQTGEINQVPFYKQEEIHLRIPLTLAPVYGSCFIVFRTGSTQSHYTDVFDAKQKPPMMEFTGNGILFLRDGIYNLQINNELKSVKISHKTQTIDGPWKISFTKGWGAPDSAIFFRTDLLDKTAVLMESGIIQELVLTGKHLSIPDRYQLQSIRGSI